MCGPRWVRALRGRAGDEKEGKVQRVVDMSSRLQHFSSITLCNQHVQIVELHAISFMAQATLLMGRVFHIP